MLAIALLAVNGVSLILDTVDAWRWLCGQRDVAGSSNSIESTETCA